MRVNRGILKILRDDCSKTGSGARGQGTLCCGMALGSGPLVGPKRSLGKVAIGDWRIPPHESTTTTTTTYPAISPQKQLYAEAICDRQHLVCRCTIPLFKYALLYTRHIRRANMWGKRGSLSYFNSHLPPLQHFPFFPRIKLEALSCSYLKGQVSIFLINSRHDNQIS